MALKLDSELLTGIDEIDSQHDQIVTVARELVDATPDNRGFEKMGKIVSFLEEYSQNHFTVEESYMARYNYPDVSVHASRHREFSDDFSVIKNRFLREGPSVELVELIRLKVIEWFIRHIKSEDRAFSDFLNKKRSP